MHFLVEFRNVEDAGWPPAFSKTCFSHNYCKIVVFHKNNCVELIYIIFDAIVRKAANI